MRAGRIGVLAIVEADVRPPDTGRAQCHGWSGRADCVGRARRRPPNCGAPRNPPPSRHACGRAALHSPNGLNPTVRIGIADRPAESTPRRPQRSNSSTRRTHPRYRKLDGVLTKRALSERAPSATRWAASSASRAATSGHAPPRGAPPLRGFRDQLAESGGLSRPGGQAVGLGLGCLRRRHDQSAVSVHDWRASLIGSPTIRRLHAAQGSTLLRGACPVFAWRADMQAEHATHRMLSSAQLLENLDDPGPVARRV